MSYELEYFPPRGTKYSWSPKALNYCPWVLSFSREKEKEYSKKFKNRFFSFYPMEITCYVDLIDGDYTWSVDVSPFNGLGYFKKVKTKTALEALKKAEEYAEQQFKKLVPNWIITALKNGWRAPCRSIL